MSDLVLGAQGVGSLSVHPSRRPAMAFQRSPRDAAPAPHVTCGIFRSACAAWAGGRRLLPEDL